MKKITKLSLNKETLVRLQELQMRALQGGRMGETESITNCVSAVPGSCTSVEKCTIVSPGGQCDAEAVLPVEGPSCCKKSCQDTGTAVNR